MQFAIYDDSGELCDLVAEVAGPGAVYMLRSIDEVESVQDWLERKHSFPRQAPIVIVTIASLQGVSVALTAVHALLNDIVAAVVIFGDVELDSLLQMVPELSDQLNELRSTRRLVRISDLSQLRAVVAAASRNSPF